MTGPFTLWVLLVLEFFIVTVLVFAGEAAARLNRVERLRQFGVRHPLPVPPLHLRAGQGGKEQRTARENFSYLATVWPAELNWRTGSGCSVSIRHGGAASSIPTKTPDLFLVSSTIEVPHSHWSPPEFNH